METQSRVKDWVEIIAKLLPGIGAVMAGIFMPLVIHISGEKSRNNQLYAEIVSKREISDTELRAKMFENLIRSKQKGTTYSIKKNLILNKNLGLIKN